MGYIGIHQPSGESQIHNDCINGFFDIWQRGDSQTSYGYDSDDRWNNRFSDTIRTHEKGYFTSDGTSTGTYDNQGVTDNPKYFSRTIISSTSDPVQNYVIKEHKIIDVQKYAGKIMRIEFWARSDAMTNITIEGYQSFGLGGSPPRRTIGNVKLSLTSSWKKFSLVINFPSTHGMIEGTTPTYQSVFFWLSAGTDYSSRTINLGVHIGTIDIAAVKIYPGPEERPIIRKSEATELWNCLPYYETKYVPYELWGADTATTGRKSMVNFSRDKVTYPSIGTSLLLSDPTGTIVADNITNKGFRIRVVGSGFSLFEKGYVWVVWTAYAEI